MKLRIVTILLVAVTLFTFAAAGCDNGGDENASQSVTSDETQFLFEKNSKILFLGDSITSAGTEEEAKPISERALSNPANKNYILQTKEYLDKVYPDYGFTYVNAGVSEVYPTVLSDQETENNLRGIITRIKNNSPT